MYGPGRGSPRPGKRPRTRPDECAIRPELVDSLAHSSGDGVALRQGPALVGGVLAGIHLELGAVFCRVARIVEA